MVSAPNPRAISILPIQRNRGAEHEGLLPVFWVASCPYMSWLYFSAALSRPNELKFLSRLISITVPSTFLAKERLHAGQPPFNILHDGFMESGKEIANRNTKQDFIAQSSVERWNRNPSFVPGHSPGVTVSQQSRELALREPASFAVSSNMADDWFLRH
jgi:hypothetical protein